MWAPLPGARACRLRLAPRPLCAPLHRKQLCSAPGQPKIIVGIDDNGDAVVCENEVDPKVRVDVVLKLGKAQAFSDEPLGKSAIKPNGEAVTLNEMARERNESCSPSRCGPTKEPSPAKKPTRFVMT